MRPPRGDPRDTPQWVCEKSPTVFHEFVVDTCCHCGYVINTPIEETTNGETA